MRIGILGGTGPAGSALAARLASVGFDVVLGSRSAERAEASTNELLERWAGRQLQIEPADNAGADNGAMAKWIPTTTLRNSA